MRKIANSALLPALLLAAIVLSSPHLLAQAARAASFLGTVQSINGNQIVVKNDAGATMEIQVQDGARLLRIEPGQKTLQNASPFTLSDLQVGDRVLARGTPGGGNKIAASTLVAIKKADIAHQQQEQQQAWERGVGGLVKSVDPAAGTITVPVMPGNRLITIHTTKNTIIRRYAPGSVKFDDAKPATLAEIKPGDQVRARGTRSADGLTFTADEIVGGSFQNVSGLITAVDPAASTFTVKDLATKKPVTIEVAPDTELKKLDPMVAQRLAVAMKGAPTRPARPEDEQAAKAPNRGSGGSGGFAGRPGASRLNENAPQQLLARAPSVQLKDLAKGDAVILVATAGKTSGSLVAVTVVSGVEPMLQASASGSQDFLSTAWGGIGGGSAAAGGDAGVGAGDSGGGAGGGGPQ